MIRTIFIGFTLLVFAFVVYAFVDCITSRPRRWLVWLLFILLGFFPISLNTASGDTRIELLSVVLLGVKIVRDTQGSNPGWILSFGVPIGALLWLGKGLFLRQSSIPGGRVTGIF